MQIFTDLYNSPIGYLQLNATETHLIELIFTDNKLIKPHKNELTKETILQLNSYFLKKLTHFTIPILPHGTEFKLKVWDILKGIPYGELWSYKDVAQELGSINYVRAVGLANGDNPIPIIIPCHRVIGSNNTIVGYGGGIWRKRWLLEHENAGMHQTLFDSGFTI